MKKSSNRFLALLAALCCFTAVSLNSASGQDRQKSATRADKYDLQVISDGSGRYLLLRGGKKVGPTVGEAIELLREQHPDSNFALAPGVADLELADLKLQTGMGTIGETLEALMLASGHRFNVGFPPAAPVDPATGLPIAGRKNGTLYLLNLTHERNSRMVEAFNLGPWLATSTNKVDADRNIASIKEMIIGTLEHLRGPNAAAGEIPEFMYHESAHVLVVIGTPEAIEVAAKLIRAVSPGPFIDPATGLPGMGTGSFGGGGSIGNSAQPGYPHPNRFGGAGLPADPAQSGGTGSLTPAPNKPGSGAPRQ